MVKFTTIAAGGVDYYQENKPASAKNGELWLPYETTVDDPTQATGVTEDTTVSHSLHSNDVYSVHASSGVVYSGDDDNTVKAAQLDGITIPPADGATSTPQLCYNGEWLQSQNGQTSGGSY